MRLFKKGERMAIDFKGIHFPKSVVLYAVYFYVRFGVSYRDPEEIMEERGVDIDPATLNRWVVKFSPLIAKTAQKRKRVTANSWRMDETYVKVKGEWKYLYRAVDRDGQTLDFMLSDRRNKAAARRFFNGAIETNGPPDRIVIDQSGANLAGIETINVIRKIRGIGPRECHELCVSGPAHAGFRYGHALKRSSNIIANWLRAANHSRTFLPPFSKFLIAR